MADRLVTLLDLAKFEGSDAAVGLIDEVNTFAPEIRELRGRGIMGTNYKYTKKVANPAGPAFRNINEGSDIVSSAYEQTDGSCFFMDAQMQVDEALVKQGLAEGLSFGGILARQASDVMAQKAINIGNQFYNGVSADAKGFTGLLANYDAVNCLVKAGGTTASVQTSAWIVWNDPQGLHWVFGNNTAIEVAQWQRQQVKDANNKALMAWVNNASGYIGLSFGHSRSVIRIANCEDATNKALTDVVIANALTKIPLSMQGNGNLKIFMNVKARYQLQKSRSVVNIGSSTGGSLVMAPTPTEAFGIPIIATDSIGNTEAVVA